MPYIKNIQVPQGFDKGTLDAGRRACAQLVRAVSSETSAPLQRAAAGSGLARLHQLLNKNGHILIAALQSLENVRATVSALVEVYSVSLREVATLTVTPGPSVMGGEKAQLKESKGISAAATSEPRAAEYGRQHPGSSMDSRGARSSCGTTDGGAGAGGGAGPSPEDWVPLLVDSSALVAYCLCRGVHTVTSTAAARGTFADFQPTEVYASGSSTLASALLHSDALPALSRLLSAEAQRGPARALLSPSQLATCLEPLNELITAAVNSHDQLLILTPQRLRQPDPPAPNNRITATTSTTPAPSPVTPTPYPTPSTSTPPTAGPSTPAPAAAKLSKGTERCPEPPTAASDPGGSAATPVPQGREPTTSPTSPAHPTPQTLGPAVICAVAESGVVEAVCRLVVVGAAEQVAGGPQQQQQQQRQKVAACAAGGDREELVRQLLELLKQLLNLLGCGDAGSLPEETLQAILAGPCVQYALAAHSVSQLHAVDGGTTYGLPYDSLLPPVREKAKDTLACYGAINALYWWMDTCAAGGYEPAPCGLTPRNLFELCLRKAEVAADCWRRRNGLPATAALAAAAGGAGGVSGSSGQGTSSSIGKAASSGKQPRRGKEALSADEVQTGRQPGLCRTAGCAADAPRGMLEPSQCPTLAMRAMGCSLALMGSSCRAGAAAGEAEALVSTGTGSGAGGSGGTDHMASPSGNTAVGEGEQVGGGGSPYGAWAGESGDGVQGSGNLPGEVGGSANVGVSGAGGGGQGGGAGAGTSSGRCGEAAEEACSSASGSGSDSGRKDSGTWLRDGGPLARRWWRAAVAAVHCGMDELEAEGSQGAASSVGQVLDLSLAMPESDPGPALPAAPPPALSAALDAGYLPCVERTLRTCFRNCNTPLEAVDFCGNDGTDTGWPLLLAFGDEREVAAFLATATKVARRACQERARPGGDRKACAAVMDWLEGMFSRMLWAAHHVARRVAVERGFRVGEAPSATVQERRRETTATGDSGSVDGGGNGSGGEGDGGGSSRLCGDGGGSSNRSSRDHSGSGGSGGSGDGSGGGGTSDGTSDGGGNAGDSDHSSGGTDGRSAGDTDAGAGACGGQHSVCGGARTCGGGSSEGGGRGDRGSGDEGHGDGLGGGGSSGGGGGSTDSSAAPPTAGTSAGCGGGAAAALAATAATTPTADGLSPPEQQLMRLLSFALRLWLPLWLDLSLAMISDGRLTRRWRLEVYRAFDLLVFVQHMWVDAFEKKDLRAAESWSSIVGRSSDEVEEMMDGCRRVLEREEEAAKLVSAGGRCARARDEGGVTAEELCNVMEDVRRAGDTVDIESQIAMVARGEVEGGREGMWPLVALGLLSPPCDASGILPCCSNPRCAELAGDSEAGVVLRRCGGACGGAAAYCCAACQRAHWVAGHREVCTGRKRGEEGGR